jgi:hypothetical protein
LGRLFDSWLQLAMLAADRLPPEPTFPRPGGQPRPSIVPGETAQRLTADAIAWFTTERANLRAATKQACHTGRVDFAGRLASHQSAYLACLHSALRSRFTEAAENHRAMTLQSARRRERDPASRATRRLPGGLSVRRN